MSVCFKLPKVTSPVRRCVNCNCCFYMAAWPSFYYGRDRKVDGSTPTQTLLLRPWIRCFTTIISAWVEFNKQQIEEVRSKM